MGRRATAAPVVRLDRLSPAVRAKIREHLDRARAGRARSATTKARTRHGAPTTAAIRQTLAEQAVPLARRGGMVRLTIAGEPRTKKNSPEIAANGQRRWITCSPHYKKWAADAVRQIRALDLPPINEPVLVEAQIYRRRKVGDSDNYYAAIGDVLERAGLLVNDGLIEGWDRSRRHIDRANPRVEITITPCRTTAAAA